MDAGGFGIRVANCVKRAGFTLEDLSAMNAMDVLQIRGIGRRGLAVIADLLEDQGMMRADFWTAV